MKRLLLLIKRAFAHHPRLRQRLVNTLYHIPFLDMRLRTALSVQALKPWQRMDPDNLPEPVRTVRDRLQARLKQP
jgi:hypothetical protein